MGWTICFLACVRHCKLQNWLEENYAPKAGQEAQLVKCFLGLSLTTSMTVSGLMAGEVEIGPPLG